MSSGFFFILQRNIIQKCGWFSIRFDSQRASVGCILHYYMCSHVEQQILVLFPTTLWDFSGDFELSPWLRVHDPWDLSWLFWNLKFDESFEIYIFPPKMLWARLRWFHEHLHDDKRSADSSYRCYQCRTVYSAIQNKFFTSGKNAHSNTSRGPGSDLVYNLIELRDIQHKS